MISSRLEKRILGYFGARVDVSRLLIDECLGEIERLAHFGYEYRFLSAPPDFLRKPPYIEYLHGSHGTIVSVMTLGYEIDKRICYYFRADGEKAVVFDACASAYLEELSDEYEKTIADDLSYRFCPGYGGSDVSDLKYIFDIVKPDRLGVLLTSTYHILPSKSMAGIIAAGKRGAKNCDGCVAAKSCSYKKEGITCYGSEKKY